MSVSQLSSVESMLSQMRQAVRAAQGQDLGSVSSAAGKASVSGGFAAELQRSLREVAATQNHANAQAQAYTLGAPGVSLNDVMIDMQKASLAFQATVQVRNRLVAAYQEIASMPI